MFATVAGSGALAVQQLTCTVPRCLDSPGQATVTASVRPLQAGSNRRKQGNHQCNDYRSALESTVQHSFSVASPQEVAVIAVTPTREQHAAQALCY